MSDETKPSEEASGEQNIRQDLVNTAINFLLNPNVINKQDVHKTAFLKKKGLTDAEISLAFKQVVNDPKYDEIRRSNNGSKTLSTLPPPLPMYTQPVSFWSQISRFSSSLVILGVALFGAHYVYKMYIEPFIFGEDADRKKSEKLEKQLQEMAKSISHLETHVSSLEEIFKGQKEQIDKIFQTEVSEYYPTPLALRELKSEIASVKSLLLNRHQFPAVPKVTPTIPQWQLPSKENDDIINQNGEMKEEANQKTSGSKSSHKDINAEDDDDDDAIGDSIIGTEVMKSADASSSHSEQLEEESYVSLSP